MKIFICHQYAIAPHQPGVTRHYLLARELIRHGHDVTIIAAAKSHKNPQGCNLQSREGARLENCQGVPFLWLRTPSSSGGQIARVWNMLCFAWGLLFNPAVKNLGDADIVIGNTPDTFTAFGALLLSKTMKSRFILHVGDLWPESLIDLGGISKWHPFILLVGVIERYLCRAAEILITPLPRADTLLLQKGARKVIHIPIVVDLLQVPLTPLPENKTFTFMYAGSMGLGNGLPGLLRAIGVFEKKYGKDLCCFRLVGDGPEMPALKKMAQDLSLSGVVFEPPVAKEKIFSVLSEADAFIFNCPDADVFRTSGISPNKLFDFMACARPIVFGCSAANNPITDAKAGLSVSADDSDAMAEAIVQMIQLETKKRQEMASSARSYILVSYQADTIGKLLEKKLLSVVGNSRFDDRKKLAV